MGARSGVIKGYIWDTMKDKRKNIKVPEELWKLIKLAAKQNNRKIIQELEVRFPPLKR